VAEARPVQASLPSASTARRAAQALGRASGLPKLTVTGRMKRSGHFQKNLPPL
jgi:hypothetical protein